ncbi:MAG: hypothetical protein KKC75_00845 [Nanoarchaeota archaeon]|nr:hypothetical protein [Nanoarchaeota archaeon]MBU1005662.1 hypothetical protein [Nanoarchaeota archaeon]MBU1946913.1 hypothetical protein [Nanoarchaeota archaeon]
MAQDLLSEFSKKDVGQFKKDFLEVIRVYHGISSEYAKLSKDVDNYISVFKGAILLFNKKYKGITLKAKATPEELTLKIYLKEKSLSDMFRNAASKLSGLKSIGATGPGKATVEEADKFSREVEKIKDKLYVSYYRQETGSSTVFLEQHENGNIELHYGEDIVSDKLPEFNICAYYAVKGGVGKEDAHEILASIGFLETPSLAKVRKLISKFSTRLGE